jgi:SAM-dependent methyltransferase
VSNRWSEVTGADADSGRRYAERFAALAASGADVHGEASFVATLVDPPARILDAGCGTGRVAIRVAELGYDVVGVDVDPRMLGEARRLAPACAWVEADLATLDLGGGFDLVVAAGNVIPLLAAGTEQAVVDALAAHLEPGGALVAGFGLDVAHLPIDFVPMDLPTYDDICARAGLELAHRFGTWDAEPFRDEGYAVSVHVRRTDAGEAGR